MAAAAAHCDGTKNDITVKTSPSGEVEVALVDMKHVGGVDGNVERRSPSSFPILFEHSANTWWNPQFDSSVLEQQLQKCLFSQTQWRFRWALFYIVVSCLVWSGFFVLMGKAHWIEFLVGTLVLLVLILAVLGFSFTRAFQAVVLPVSVGVIVVLCLADLLSYVYENPDLLAVGTFTGSIEILIVLYTCIPLPLYLCVGIGVFYSVMFEVLSVFLTGMNNVTFVACRVLIHFAVHVIGIHIFLMSQVRKRSTFLKVCQSVRLRQDLEMEKQLKRCMINSLMPPKVAEEIMKSRECGDHEREPGREEEPRRKVSGGLERGRMTFRSFHMSQMDNVSILFADIVGFTKMSSKKTAEHLVYLLSDLFGRFDKICVECNCEKISTLGDCYYCVSGCPEPRADHAKCCAEMGLKMCVAIKQFDRDHNEEVNMRVGVHTGTVLCGLVGTRRFKFDVWSHDVTLANMMESEGRAGLVHISDCTYGFVKDDYDVEKGEAVPDIRGHRLLTEFFDSKTQQFIVQHVEKTGVIDTWFIVNRKSEGAAGTLNGTALNDYSRSPPDGASDAVAVSVGDEEETKELDQKENNMSAVQLFGRKENSSHEDINGEAGNNGTAVTHLLSSKKQEDTEETDLKLMSIISKQTENYLYHPAINHWTLNFRSSKLESKYKRHYTEESTSTAGPTFASPHISSLFDMVVSVIFFVVVSICCFIAFEVRLPLVTVFVVAMVLELFVLALMALNAFTAKGGGCQVLEKIRTSFASWYPRHLFGGVIASLPTVAVYSTFLCATFVSGVPLTDQFYCLLLIASLLHFCNFTMLSFWMKSCLATAAGLLLIILLGIGFCSKTASSAVVVGCDFANSSCYGPPGNGTTDALFWKKTSDMYEIVVSAALLLLLIWFLNREIEISYRICYHGDIEALKDRRKMVTEEQQADWLLHNIVPEHVAEHLKQNKHYSKTHKDIGVIFAKIVNFEDFYDESFQGGKEYLRVLNELMGDFEELFDDAKYKDIEKIKTIGSCLMAASGLNPQTKNDDPNAHLRALMDFSYELLHKLEQFNKEIFNFDFEMSIGYNFGEVTAGVVGTTKLLYDIWGDTVNIASRMYSTGVHGRIQVTEDTAIRLKDDFDFEPRGQVFVKGKGDMNVFLLAEKRRSERKA